MLAASPAPDVAALPECVPAGELPEADPRLAARTARLRYVSDTQPGIRRSRAGRGFRYVDAAGEPLHDPAELKRIRALGIPPAWRDVWICAHPRGHIQATGRDARGRKQYRYHPDWQAVRDETKYTRVLAFAANLPRLRARVEADLARDSLSREQVLATVVRIMDLTGIRVGNAEYARQNASYGLTTLRQGHVAVEGARLQFQFRGKSGKEHDIAVRDRRLARTVKRLLGLEGEVLFQYLDASGEAHAITADDVNEYLRAATGEEFSAKDFRTWSGTVLAAQALSELGAATSATHGKRQITAAIKQVARELGNTPAVCRRCYVHPLVLEAYSEGTLLDALAAEAPPLEGLRPAEVSALVFLQSRPTLAAEPPPRRPAGVKKSAKPARAVRHGGR